jgi:tRNA modification GTPase
MDLTEVDGLADLIAAETEMQKMQALNQMGGSLSRIYHEWRDRLAKVRNY